MSSLRRELPPDLAEAFPEDLLAALVEALRGLYDGVPTAVEYPGFDETCFGLAVYRMARVELEAAVGGGGNEFEVRVEDNAFLYVVNGVAFTCQRVGTTREVEIEGAFPRNYRVGLRQFLDYRQGQKLFDFAREKHVEVPPLVLAHIGNDEDGLLGAYLCRPEVVTDGHIRKWGLAVELYRARGEDDGFAAAIKSTADVPPAEHIDRAAVLPKRQQREQSAE